MVANTIGQVQMFQMGLNGGTTAQPGVAQPGVAQPGVAQPGAVPTGVQQPEPFVPGPLPGADPGNVVPDPTPFDGGNRLGAPPLPPTGAPTPFPTPGPTPPPTPLPTPAMLLNNLPVGPGGVQQQAAQQQNQQVGNMENGASSDEDDGLSDGSVIAIVAVGLLLCVLIGVLAFCVVSRARPAQPIGVSNAFYDQSGRGVGLNGMGGAWGQPMNATPQRAYGNELPQRAYGNSLAESGQFGRVYNDAGGSVRVPGQPVNMQPSYSATGTANMQQSYGARERFATAFDAAAALPATPTESWGRGQHKCPYCPDKFYHYEQDVQAHIEARHSL